MNICIIPRTSWTFILNISSIVHPFFFLVLYFFIPSFSICIVLGARGERHLRRVLNGPHGHKKEKPRECCCHKPVCWGITMCTSLVRRRELQ